MERGIGIGIGSKVEGSGAEESFMVSRMGLARDIEERSLAT